MCHATTYTDDEEHYSLIRLRARILNHYQPNLAYYVKSIKSRLLMRVNILKANATRTPYISHSRRVHRRRHGQSRCQSTLGMVDGVI